MFDRSIEPPKLLKGALTEVLTSSPPTIELTFDALTPRNAFIRNPVSKPELNAAEASIEMAKDRKGCVRDVRERLLSREDPEDTLTKA